ncbi:hypothetical protein [Microvirga sp. VF16]|uniref:hypothetical protein n=1 Tax=Microvirga sp. VF16 TaxID=2807101 RepID=UPI00193CEDA3|nr:hypothetical protein [Microvirga sp. VF16]QRM34914.1 hypothetical protein JO965_42400 [Microvirga sp. VF16]
MKTRLHGFADRAADKLKAHGYNIKRSHLYDAITAGFSLPDTNVLFAREKAGSLEWPTEGSAPPGTNKSIEDVYSYAWRLDGARNVVPPDIAAEDTIAGVLLSILYCDPIHLLSFNNPEPVTVKRKDVKPGRVIFDLITGTPTTPPLKDPRALLLHMMRSWKLTTVDSFTIRRMLILPDYVLLDAFTKVAHHIAAYSRSKNECESKEITLDQPMTEEVFAAEMEMWRSGTPDSFLPSNTEAFFYNGSLAEIPLHTSYLAAWGIADVGSIHHQIVWLARQGQVIIVEGPKQAHHSIVNGVLALMSLSRDATELPADLSLDLLDTRLGKPGSSARTPDVYILLIRPSLS